MKLIWLMRPFSPTMISLATVFSRIWTKPVAIASFNVMVGSYFAWMGQIGMQLVLPAQARRCLYGWELRAAGSLLTGIFLTGFPISRNSVLSSLRLLSAASTARSNNESGISGIGYL